MSGTSLVVQGLSLHTPNAGHPGSIPGESTRFHMLQLLNKSWHAALKILHAPTETCTNLKNVKSNTHSHMVGAYC